MARPQTISWYISALKYDIIEDLKNNPDLLKKIKNFKKRFISWCANQRVLFESDIIDEFNEFNKKFILSRLYNIDIKLWHRISQFIFKRDNYICAYCGKRGGILEIDHIVPISSNGNNNFNNLITSCRKCNRQKKNKSKEEFTEWKKNNG